MKESSNFGKNLTKSFSFVKAVIQFIRDVASDPRIPQRDKSVILALLALLISPLDLIPDWIPVLGMLDDVVVLALILDYFFNVLDQDILLSHYPWGMKSFAFLRRTAKTIAVITPTKIKDKVWKYRPPVV